MTVPPATDEVRADRDGAVLTITLDRPADQNRLTRENSVAEWPLAWVHSGLAY
jgi:hypothetical protein